MPKFKKTTAVQRAKRKKLLKQRTNDTVRSDLSDCSVTSKVDRRKIISKLRAIIKSILPCEDFKRFTKTTNKDFVDSLLAFYKARKRRRRKSGKIMKVTQMKKMLAIATHFFFRTRANNSAIAPFQLTNIFKTRPVHFALLTLRHMKRSHDLRARYDYKNKRVKSMYHGDNQVQNRKAFKCRRRYQQNKAFRERESRRARLRYQTDSVVKAIEQKRNRQEYRENQRVKSRELTRNRKAYHEKKGVKERQRELKRKNYEDCVVSRTRQQIRKRNDYQKNESIKLRERKRNLTKYHESEEIRSNQKGRKKNSYQNNSNQRIRKKISVKITYASNPEAQRTRKRRSYHDDTDSQPSEKRRRETKKNEKRKTLEQNMTAYFTKIRNGPTVICSCCGGLFYKDRVTSISVDDMELKFPTLVDKVICFKDENDPIYKFCSTDMYWIKQKKVPRCAMSNGLNFPAIPPELQGLTRLEERLVSARIPFMQIRQLGSEGQYFLNGNVVNVENNMEKVVQCLPRKFNEMSITQLKFKRRMADSNHFLYDKIRPKKVVEAIRYLFTTPLYQKQENLYLNENWDNFNADEVNFIVQDEDKQEHEQVAINRADSEDVNLGAEETLYYTPSTAEPVEIHVAPGEGNVPIAKFRDPDAEYLSFPSIYCGQERNYNPDAKLTYSTILRWELRFHDRRAAVYEKILYGFKMYFVQRVRDAYSICLRQKNKGNGKPITAKDIRTPGFLESTFNKDDGYKVFKHVRSTPCFWKNQVKRVIAMVRQLGNCTFFITLSAAETKWNELIVILVKILRGADITEEEAESLPRTEKSDLIRSDPVTCARHFEHKYRALMHHLIKENNGIFPPTGVVDYYTRVEYQMRGSPHSHGLYWVKDAPKYTGDEQSAKTCVEFIDKYITCKRDDSEDIAKYIKYQNHGHSPTCTKNRVHRKCRFHFPRPPLPETMILNPLDKTATKEEVNKAKSDYTKIEQKLDEMGKDFLEIIPFEDFLKGLELSEEEYITAIRSTIRSAHVFLKRETNAAFINNYNRNLLLAWKANIDIQFVLDPYACARYCVGYILKSEGGVSKLLKRSSEDSRLHGEESTCQDRLKKFGSILIHGSEISAQEAVGFILGLPNTDASRGEVFINTNRVEGRIGMLKPPKELEELPDDSEDICMKGMLHRYTIRNEKMESTCLADFAAFYEFSKKGRKFGELENDDEEDLHTKKTRAGIREKIWLQDNSGYVQRRQFAKIIRFRHFSKALEPQEYYRERLMLFFPWRNEKEELDNVADTKKKYFDNYNEIKANSKEYFHDKNFDEERLRDLIDTEEFENEDDEVVTNELEDLEDERYAIAQLTETPQKSSTSLTLKPPRIMTREEFCKIMRSLNINQRRIVNEILYRLKLEKTPFHIFLSGGAGVGKSHVIKALVQGILHHRFNQPGSPEDIPVVVTAPTGKAAFNVSGMTMHHAFKLSANQSKDDFGLVASTANTLRIKYAMTEAFIIDEISLAGAKQASEVSDHLNTIFNTPPAPATFFGNRSVIAVGDFRQLPPIGSYHIFKSPLKSQENNVRLNPLWALFKYFELDEIMRQKGEWEFCKALNNMAKGEMDDDDIKLLKSREITSTCFPPPEAVYLFAWNQDCAAYNNSYHATLDTEGAISIAADKISGRGSKQKKEQLLKRAATELSVQESDGVMYEVTLKVGGIFMVTTNVNVSDGIFNGSTGILRHIEYGMNASKRIPIVAWMEFETPVIGQETRRKYSFKRPECISILCVPIERYTRNIAGAKKKLEGHDLTRTQIPLLAANAMTIAKSQGSSLKHVVVNTSIRKLTREQLYVACSRATSPTGLWIQGKFTAPQKPHQRDQVVREIKRLREDCPLQFSQLSPILMPMYSKKIYFHNIETFRVNQSDVEADQNINCCDIIAFVEHHVHANKNPTLNDYHRVNFIPCSGHAMGDSKGSLIFARKEIPENLISNICQDGNRGHMIITTIDFDRIKLVICYKHPAYSGRDFIRQLKQIISNLLPSEVIVVGDININISTSEGTYAKEALEALGLLSRLPLYESTTERGTQIDICFSNIHNLVSSTYETYYSYHRGINIMFN